MGFSVDPPYSPRQGVGGWQVEWANPTLEASYDKRKRGGYKPGEEEPGGEGGAEGGGGQHAPEGSNFFPEKFDISICMCEFYFHFLK